MERIRCPERLHTIEILSDKYRCRSVLKPLLPDFYFETEKLSEIKEDMFVRDRKYIIKPSKGFFGTGVKLVDGQIDIHRLVDEIRQEIDLNSRVFSERVFSK